jgi:hypothetical protein
VQLRVIAENKLIRVLKIQSEYKKKCYSHAELLKNLSRRSFGQHQIITQTVWRKDYSSVNNIFEKHIHYMINFACFLQVLHATKLVLYTIVQTQWNSIANRLTAKQVMFDIFLYIATKCFANNAQSNIRLLLFAKLRRTWHNVADFTTQRCFKQEQLHR